MCDTFALGAASMLISLAERYGLGNWSYCVNTTLFRGSLFNKHVKKTPEELAEAVLAAIEKTQKKANEDEAWILSEFDMLG